MTHTAEIENDSKEQMEFLTQTGSLSPESADRMLENERRFEQKRKFFETQYRGKWVAVLGDIVFIASRYAELAQDLGIYPNGNDAYSEKIYMH